MRQHKAAAAENAFSILTVDDDNIMTSTVQAYFQRSGYRVDVENDPLHAIERVKEQHYDIMLLDFLMTPICGDQVVEKIRQFDKDIFIILLTGHKTMAPPIRTIRALDIQGYYEKSDRFDQLELLVESCVKSIRQLRTIRSYQNGLTAMMNSLPAIYHLQGMDDLLDSVLTSAISLLSAEAAMLLLENMPSGNQPDSIQRSKGTENIFPSGEELDSIKKQAAENGKLIQDRSLYFDLNYNGRRTGLLAIYLKKQPEYWQCQLLEVFARQTAAALDNILLHTLVQQKTNQLDKAYNQLRNSYTEMIATVREIVDAKDFYTRHHSDRVAFYSVELAEALGYDGEYCERLRVAGLLHDIGKLGIPDSILLKPLPLTDEEFAVIKTHPAMGAQLLSGITWLKDIIPWVRGHHERYDGKGYPDGLAGEDIPQQARIIAVADAFDAMTSDRRYRSSLSLDKALAELEKVRGSQLDPHFVDVFKKLVTETDMWQRAATIIDLGFAGEENHGK